MAIFFSIHKSANPKFDVLKFKFIFTFKAVLYTNQTFIVVMQNVVEKRSPNNSAICKTNTNQTVTQEMLP